MIPENDCKVNVLGEIEMPKDWCLRCYISYSKGPGVYQCLVCGDKLIDHKPSGQEIVAWREKNLKPDKVLDNDQIQCGKCDEVYSKGYKKCPGCILKAGGSMFEATGPENQSLG